MSKAREIARKVQFAASFEDIVIDIDKGVAPLVEALREISDYGFDIDRMRKTADAALDEWEGRKG